MKMKNKLFVLAITLGLTVFSTGIWMNAQQMQHKAYANQAVTKSEECEIISFEDYLGEDIDELSENQIKTLKTLYEKILAKEKAEKFDDADKLWRDFRDLLRDYDIDTPFENFDEYMETIKGDMNEKDYIKISNIYEEIEDLNGYLDTLDDEKNKKEIEETEKNIEDLWDEIGKILSPLGYDIDEIVGQIESKNVILALYDVNEGKIQYKPSNKHTIEELSKEEISNHQQMWERAKKIIPKSYLGRIVSFEVNTDGKDNVLAHVISPDESNKIWRLAIDIKDALDKDGKLIGKELNNTLIHEFGHILTLNDSQMMKDKKENSNTYTTDEGTTIKDAYLNQFYNKFWKELYKEWKKASESEADENGENQALIDFYEKHKDIFVSEYASTNPEEDIAESFMQFVTEDKPKGNSVANKKILFFYEFDELIKIREEIRTNIK